MYQNTLPQELQKHYMYTADGGHCIKCILEQHLQEAKGQMEDFIIPLPAKTVLRNYKIIDDIPVAYGVKYDNSIGAIIDEDDYEYGEAKSKEFVAIQTGKQVPQELLQELQKAPAVERAFCTTVNDAYEAYIILGNITNQELKELKGSVSVIVQDLELPMLVLKYKNMSFDMALQGNIPNGNSLRTMIIDLNGYIVKHQRILGLNEKITSAIKTSMKKIQGVPTTQVLHTLQDIIYPKYTPEMLCRGGLRQDF